MMKTATTTKLSKRTLDLFKNFSAINANLYIEPGDRIYTLTQSATMCAEAKIEETFDTKFGIFDLPKFLGIVSLFNNPEFEFDDKFVTVYGQDNSKVKFYYCELKLIDKLVKNFGKAPKLKEVRYSFDISAKQISELTRASSVLSLKNISIEASENSGVTVSIFDKENSTPNSYAIEASNGTVHSEDANKILIYCENVSKIYSGDYRVDVTDNVSCWTHKTIDLKYYIANDTIKE